MQTPGEPALLTYWLRNFETWRDEIDELIVLINNNNYPELRAYDAEAVTAAGGRVIFAEGRVQHGDCIDRMLRETSDLVMLTEDDAFVRRPGAVKAAFDRIESGATDIIGSPRYQDFINVPIEEHWGPITADWSEIGRVLWPTFLFARSADLAATDRRFGFNSWEVGETIAGLELTVTPELCKYVGTGSNVLLDVFYGTSYQLRAAGHRIEHVNRVRVYQAEATEAWWQLDPPWMHVTELSTFLGTIMPEFPGRGAMPKELIADLKPGGGYWCRRVAWWERMLRTACPPIAGYAQMYREWMDRFIELADIDLAAVAAWDQRIDPWITWDES